MTRTPVVGASVAARRDGARWARFAPALIGLLAGVLAFVGAGIPSYWGDEAASVLSAQRSVPSLFALLDRIDAVHGLYYLFLHGWIEVAGSSEAMVRLPSGIATGLAAAGVVVLGSRLVGAQTGVLAGLVYAVLPVVTHMGMEARSSAFTMAAAVWLVVWLVTLVRRGERRWWVWLAFGIGFAASISLFLYLAMLVVVQLAVLVVLRARRPIVLRWLGASAVAAVLAVPIFVLGFSERGQIEFLSRRSYATAESVVVGQWFGVSWGVAVVAWLLVAIAIAAACTRAGRAARPVVVVAGVWLVLPTAALLAGNAWVTPMYNLRYTAFCAPALALLMAVGMSALGAAALRARASTGTRVVARRLVPIAALAIVVGLALPGYLAQRGPFAKDDGADLRQTADVIAANAAAGDAIVFDQSTKPSRRPRLAIDLYPDRFAGLVDIALRRPLESRRTLWDAVTPLPKLAGQVASHQRVWAVEGGPSAPDVAVLRALGFEVARTIPVHRTVIYELVKEQP